MLTRKKSNDRPWQEVFLEAFERMGNVSRACKAAGISRQAAYQHREDNAEFKAAWDGAREVAADELEAEAWRRAVKGTKKPVYQGGEHVGDVQEYSDTLLIFLMKGARPEKYRERAAVQHQFPDGIPITLREVVVELPPADDDEREPEGDAEAPGPD